jgi:hypothetical protein
MLKRLSLLFILLAFLCPAKAQFDTTFAKSNIRRCADSLVRGFRTRNWELYARYSYPAMIGTMGGTKEFISYISGMFSQVPDSAWKLYEPGHVLQVIKTERDLQAIIELNSLVEWQGIRATSTAYLIAESWDGGMFWTFFDSQADAKAVKIIKPDLSDQLVIPQKKETIEPMVPPDKNKAPVKSKN